MKKPRYIQILDFIKKICTLVTGGIGHLDLIIMYKSF